MKDKIMLFIIGALVGAVIATGAFYIYTITGKSCDCSSNNTQMNGGQPPEIPNGQNSEDGQPPEKPSGENGEPPAKPSESNSQKNN
jgi:hypothetical protein